VSSIIIDAHTHPYTYACIYAYISSTHLCTQPAASAFADVYVGVTVHLCNVHTCPCTSAQNTCPKVHATLTAKKCTHIYTYTHMHTHTYVHEHTCACMTPSARCSTDTENHTSCTNVHTQKHTHVYKRIHIHIHTHMHMYAHIHVRTLTHIHIYAHTHTRTQARLERRCGSERARSWCRRRKPCTSLSFDTIKPHLTPPMLGLHCTHFLRHQYPSTPHPLFAIQSWMTIKKTEISAQHEFLKLVS